MNKSQDASSSASYSSVQDACERLEVMCSRFEKSYHILNNNTAPTVKSRNGKQIDIEDCRSKMASWCYKIIEYCNMSPETAEIAMYYLDRFMWTESSSQPNSATSPFSRKYLANQARAAAWANKKVYQLAAMTALYTAAKTRERMAMNPEHIATKLSHGTYTELQIKNMESLLLEALEWKMNPPSIISFVQEMTAIIAPILDAAGDSENDFNSKAVLSDPYVQRTFQDLVNQQIQILVQDFDMITTKAPIKAYCCVLNALEILGVSPSVLQQVSMTLRRIIRLPQHLNHDDYNDELVLISIQEMRTHLYDQLTSNAFDAYPSSSGQSRLMVACATDCTRPKALSTLIEQQQQQEQNCRQPKNHPIIGSHDHAENMILMHVSPSSISAMR